MKKLYKFKNIYIAFSKIEYKFLWCNRFKSWRTR